MNHASDCAVHNMPAMPADPCSCGEDFQPGDCRAVHVGEVRLENGRVIKGAVVEFPAGPPDLPFRVVWDGTPLTLAVEHPE